MASNIKEMNDTSNIKESKKRKIENKLQNNNDLLLPNNTDNIQCMTFNTKSTTMVNTSHQVKMYYGSNGIQFSCTCGDRWKINPPYNNCKHIGSIIANMVTVFVQNNYAKLNHIPNKNKKVKNNDGVSIEKNDQNMEDMIENFKQLMF